MDVIAYNRQGSGGKCLEVSRRCDFFVIFWFSWPGSRKPANVYSRQTI